MVVLSAHYTPNRSSASRFNSIRRPGFVGAPRLRQTADLRALDEGLDKSVLVVFGRFFQAHYDDNTLAVKDISDFCLLDKLPPLCVVEPCV